jgi:hypothetical protein
MLKQDTLHNEIPTLYLIDLHRAQIRKKVPRRWLIKICRTIFFHHGFAADKARLLLFSQRIYWWTCKTRAVQSGEILEKSAAKSRFFIQKESRKRNVNG